MSLQAQARNAVEVAFRSAGDAVQSVTWHRPTLGTYDPATGTRTNTSATVTVRAVEEKVSNRTATRLALSARAVRIWVPAVDFEGQGLAIADALVDDKFVHRGVTYTARECTFEGVKAIWEIHGDI